MRVAALVLACALTLAGCTGMGLIVECIPSLIDPDPYRQLCQGARPKPGAAVLYYAACPELGDWRAIDKWPEDCAPLKAKLGVQ